MINQTKFDDSKSDLSKTNGRNNQSNAIEPPSITLPKGGGAIRGIGEKFAVNPVTGTGNLAFPIFASPGRSGFGPQLSLSYDSGSGNGPFGLGWHLALASVTRKTDKGLPKYRDAVESDVFILSGVEDLVPVGDAVEDASKKYRIQRYRPRIEGLFACIERWTELESLETHWRSISKENVTTVYGAAADSRIFDPADGTRIFSWLICESYDDRGNAIRYEYSAENDAGVETAAANERNRRRRSAQRYLKRIKYGNKTPRRQGENLRQRTDWMFEVVFDYGEHYPEEESHEAVDEKVDAAAVFVRDDQRPWAVRQDPFSSYRSGFEVRTYRLCRRVLMFHHFPDELKTEDYLVRATHFSYSQDPSVSFITAITQSGYVLQTADQTYLKRSLPPVEFEYSQAVIDGTIREVDEEEVENLPFGLDGSRYQWIDLDGEGLTGILTEQGGAWFYKRNLSMLPVAGSDGKSMFAARFAPVERLPAIPSPANLSGGQLLIDLAGDGRLDVVEFESSAPGYYERTSDEGWENFTPFEALPNINWKDPNLRFIDLTGDGQSDLLITEDEVLTWYPSRAEDGFGPSEKVSRAFDEEAGPRIVFADGTQSIYLADLSGDGLTDLVRIRNGEVCYWSNLGYGRFGAKVTMDDPPWFDAPDQFDQKRIRLADIDGSGTIDIIYLGRDGVYLYFNRSGNGWSPASRLDNFPPADDLSSVMAIDLLGNGTACLVWSSPLPGAARRPLRYIDLMGGRKPHLLVKAANNLGAETQVDYAPSTKFYLADKYAGRPWITKLPFPVYCVEKVTVTDKWRKTRFSTSYSYHHGYFDGFEREFRGFGRVEQVDVESFGEFLAGNASSPFITADKTLYQPPVKTITWFHTGAAIDRRHILTQFQSEFFPKSLAALPGYSARLTGFNEKTLPEPDLESQDLSADEWREALRACKGMMLRQEIYELDVDQLETGKHIPVRLFSAAAHNCRIIRLQPGEKNRRAVFLVTESEALSYHYELDLRPVTLPPDPKNVDPLKPDPRVAHTLNLLFDKYGNVEQSVAVGYKRMQQFDDQRLADLTVEHRGVIDKVQDAQHLIYTETHYTDDAIEPKTGAAPVEHHRLRVPYQIRSYELTGIDPPPGSLYFDLSTLREYHLSDTLPDQGAKPVSPLEYHELPDRLTTQKRKIEHTRTLFFIDDQTDPLNFLKNPLPLGRLGKLGLPFERYKLALTEQLLESVFTDDQLNTVVPGDGASTETVLEKLNRRQISGYLSGTDAADKFGPAANGQYWMRSGVAGFAPDAAQRFYLPEKYTDPFNNITSLVYDGKYHLFIESSTDALGNQKKIFEDPDPNVGLRFDYRVLAPAEIEDLNGNRTEVCFDALGMVVSVAVKGKGAEADNLDGYTDEFANPVLAGILDYFDLPPLTVNQARDLFSPLLGNATTRFLYHFGQKIENGKTVWNSCPAGACAIVRERHVASLLSGDPPSPLQIGFECSDGLGTVLMTRIQAEPETAAGNLRWIVSGRTVLNNKGKPVKQYEPYFSVKASCCAEDGAEQAEVGVTPLIFYDAVGRTIRTEMPDGSFSYAEFSPWHVMSFDRNDTAFDPKGGNHSDWYKRRTDPRHPRFNEFDSAENARAAESVKMHAATPVLTILDSLGREVVSLVHNRVEDANGPFLFGGKRYADQRCLTYTELDAEGKPLWIRDDRGNLVMQYVLPIPPRTISNRQEPAAYTPAYDIAGNLLFQHSMDAGDRWMLNDAAGKPMFAWDSRGNLLMSSYDALRRPTKLELKNPDHPAWIVVGLTQYGEGTTGDRGNNRRGKPYRVFDQSGVATNREFDFKGNALRLNRRLALDYEGDTDWTAALQLPLDQEPGSLLMPEIFTQTTEYDALNRITRQDNWHRAGRSGAVYEPRYNARGLLVSQDLTVSASKTGAIQNIVYDAKGQRLRITFGNSVTIRYTYDAETFRLTTLLSTRPNKPVLQNLSYTYDPGGNVTEIYDDAVPTEFFNNAVIEPRKKYVYDALYRLIEATGREHAGQLNHGALDNWDDCPYRVDHGANNSKAWRNYVQRYTYDSVGNMLVMQHTALGSSADSWTRRYQYAVDSNRFLSSGIGAAPVNHYAAMPTLDYGYSYNEHGSMTSLPQLSAMDWDHTEHLRRISRAPSGLGADPDGCPDSSLEAWYRYDAAKQRTRKRVKKQGGILEERFYLGGLEWYRRWRTLNAALVLVEEIETLHLFDGEQRLLMVDQVIETDRPELGKRSLYRYTLSNHLGSSTVEADENADVISYEEYHPYGTTAYQSGRNAAEVKLKRYRYTGMERDEESGLSYHGARYFAAQFGQWISTDPLGVADGTNVYQYSHSNPIMGRDRTGTQDEERVHSFEEVPITGDVPKTSGEARAIANERYKSGRPTESRFYEQWAHSLGVREGMAEFHLIWEQRSKESNAILAGIFISVGTAAVSGALGAAMLAGAGGASAGVGVKVLIGVNVGLMGSGSSIILQQAFRTATGARPLSESEVLLDLGLSVTVPVAVEVLPSAIKAVRPASSVMDAAVAADKEIPVFSSNSSVARGQGESYLQTIRTMELENQGATVMPSQHSGNKGLDLLAQDIDPTVVHVDEYKTLRGYSGDELQRVTSNLKQTKTLGRAMSDQYVTAQGYVLWNKPDVALQESGLAILRATTKQRSILITNEYGDVFKVDPSLVDDLFELMPSNWLNPYSR